MRPRLLDLFCGAGGAARGYQLAGFHVTGVDIAPQPNYCGDEFVQADALSVLDGFLEWRDEGQVFHRDFDAIHASPPCQAYSNLRHASGSRMKPALDLVDATRDLLEASGLPWVMENVPGAPLRHQIVLCGSMFGLGTSGRQLRRHRLFESNVSMMSPPCSHVGEALGVYGWCGAWNGGRYTFANGVANGIPGRKGGYQGTIAEKREAMGIDWMSNAEINQAIPPAYTEFIGGYLMAAVQREAVVSADP